jgi:hypothetical protein
MFRDQPFCCCGVLFNPGRATNDVTGPDEDLAGPLASLPVSKIEQRLAPVLLEGALLLEGTEWFSLTCSGKGYSK